MDIVMKIVLTQKAINNALMDFVCQIDTQGQIGRILSRLSIIEGSTKLHANITNYYRRLSSLFKQMMFHCNFLSISRNFNQSSCQLEARV